MSLSAQNHRHGHEISERPPHARQHALQQQRSACDGRVAIKVGLVVIRHRAGRRVRVGRIAQLEHGQQEGAQRPPALAIRPRRVRILGRLRKGIHPQHLLACSDTGNLRSGGVMEPVGGSAGHCRKAETVTAVPGARSGADRPTRPERVAGQGECVRRVRVVCEAPGGVGSFQLSLHPADEPMGTNHES